MAMRRVVGHHHRGPSNGSASSQRSQARGERRVRDSGNDGPCRQAHRGGFIFESNNLWVPPQNHGRKSGAVEITGGDRAEDLGFVIDMFRAEEVRHSAARVLLAYSRIIEGHIFLRSRLGPKGSRFADIAMPPVQSDGPKPPALRPVLPPHRRH